jgi:hypothetical protein
MATPARAPIKVRTTVPLTSLTHSIEVDDWLVEELESSWKRVARKVNDLFRGTRAVIT